MIEIFFWFFVWALVHSYVIYPLSLRLYPREKGQNDPKMTHEELPKVSILLSLYNEANSVSQKVTSTFHTDYPLDKLTLLIGSDGSDDGTEEKVNELKKKYRNIRFFPFKERRGKASVINDLVKHADDAILIFTDAHAIFENNTIPYLVNHFQDAKVGMVGARMLNKLVSKDGISVQENAYLHLENKLKISEGEIWGVVMGVFGACYAIRKDCYVPVPPHFLVDDFFVTFKVLEQKKKVLYASDAVFYENVTNRSRDEFRRKVRISAGNFQNLWHFRSFLWPKSWGLFYAYWSHKVLRWLGPFFIIGALGLNAALVEQQALYRATFVLQILLILGALSDLVFRKLNLHLKPLRFLNHFYAMNLGLLFGFFKLLFGKRKATWKPTKR